MKHDKAANPSQDCSNNGLRCLSRGLCFRILGYFPDQDLDALTHPAGTLLVAAATVRAHTPEPAL